MQMTIADPGPTTRYDWVDARLQAEIALGNLLPGHRVKVNDLAVEWKMSPSPLREAVQRLAARGVLTMSPQRGARVADISLEEARELYELRIQLEPQAPRCSLENSDPSYVADVKAAHKAFVALRKRPNPPTVAEVYRAHRAFHDSTYARCTSRWLLHSSTCSWTRLCATCATPSTGLPPGSTSTPSSSIAS